MKINSFKGKQNMDHCKKDFSFYSSFKFTAKLRTRYRDFPYTPTATHAQPPLLSTPPTTWYMFYNW